jgi:hypothetical protein
MIEATVKKIMFTGINKYAKSMLVASEQVQIKVTNDEHGTVFYEICNNFKVVEKVSFLNIMDKKMDLFGYESMSSPFMKKSLLACAKDNDADINDVSVFILKHGDNIGLAFYNKFKNIKTIPLSKHLEGIGF